MIPDIIGNIGVVSFLVAYFMLQKGVVSYTNPKYLILNLIGALFVLFSLMFAWNLSAFLLEAAWAIITLQTMYKHMYLPWRSKRKGL